MLCRPPMELWPFDPLVDSPSFNPGYRQTSLSVQLFLHQNIRFPPPLLPLSLGLLTAPVEDAALFALISTLCLAVSQDFANLPLLRPSLPSTSPPLYPPVLRHALTAGAPTFLEEDSTSSNTAPVCPTWRTNLLKIKTRRQPWRRYCHT